MLDTIGELAQSSRSDRRVRGGASWTRSHNISTGVTETIDSAAYAQLQGVAEASSRRNRPFRCGRARARRVLWRWDRRAPSRLGRRRPALVESTAARKPCLGLSRAAAARRSMGVLRPFRVFTNRLRTSLRKIARARRRLLRASLPAAAPRRPVISIVTSRLRQRKTPLAAEVRVAPRHGRRPSILTGATETDLDAGVVIVATHRVLTV